jgi:hypothetical protein
LLLLLSSLRMRGSMDPRIRKDDNADARLEFPDLLSLYTFSTFCFASLTKILKSF